jgi:hypothetical protein
MNSHCRCLFKHTIKMKAAVSGLRYGMTILRFLVSG